MDHKAQMDCREPEIIIVVPPVLNPKIPTLGASVLAATCAQAGVPTRVHYASVSFAAHIGCELCERLSASPPRKMLGEAVFMATAFPEREHMHSHILNTLTQMHDPLSQIMTPPSLTQAEVAHCAAKVPGFISHTAELLLGWHPRIVGFSAMCQQTLASISIARFLKKLRPEIITVLGGANAAAPMGSAIQAMTDAFDYVFSGEADIAFPEFCREYLDKRKLPDKGVIHCEPIDDLKNVAAPNYDDYFEEIELFLADQISMPAKEIPYWLIYESSRGCWWSERCGCTFCGFNDPNGKYRVKPPAKLIKEIEDLVSRYSVHHFYAADTIMAQDFPERFLSRLIEQGTNVTLSYEVKSNLKEEDINTLVRAGVTEIQPGIESLSDNVLRLMSKGVRALENVRLLRDTRSRGLDVIWNLLTAIPGEKREDYEIILALIPQIEHLQPPTRWGPIRISRYSQYHRNPKHYGIRGLRPWSVYFDLYGEYAEGVAQHFIGDYETEFTLDVDLQTRLDTAIRKWAVAWFNSDNPPFLYSQSLGNGKVAVHDSRSVAKAGTQILYPDQAKALEAVRTPKHMYLIPQIQRSLIENLVDMGLVAASENQFLSLVTEPEIGSRLWAERQQILDRSSKEGVA
jgi:ribosomal peptide maturation radical SAM protein 1